MRIVKAQVLPEDAETVVILVCPPNRPPDLKEAVKRGFITVCLNRHLHLFMNGDTSHPPETYKLDILSLKWTGPFPYNGPKISSTTKVLVNDDWMVVLADHELWHLEGEQFVKIGDIPESIVTPFDWSVVSSSMVYVCKGSQLVLFHLNQKTAVIYDIADALADNNLEWNHPSACAGEGNRILVCNSTTESTAAYHLELETVNNRFAILPIESARGSIPPALTSPLGKRVQDSLALYGRDHNGKMRLYTFHLTRHYWYECFIPDSLRESIYPDIVYGPLLNEMFIFTETFPNQRVFPESESAGIFNYFLCIDLAVIGTMKPFTNINQEFSSAIGNLLINNPGAVDLNILTLDGKTVQVSSRILCRRWGKYFQDIYANAVKEAGPGVKPVVFIPQSIDIVMAVIDYLYKHTIGPESSSVSMLGQLMLFGRMHELPDLYLMASRQLHYLLAESSETSFMNVSDMKLVFQFSSLCGNRRLQRHATRLLLETDARDIVFKHLSPSGTMADITDLTSANT
ncbi:hypothetical protein CANCADRAFT_139234 [Tortispora caseinolytica NRRL Y-17796]|uniref:BTB domain-containing protein n=1 Tax=Tortispora caseinolytica NRRL Y-17796 TaxID=767744 RepID=A0A1E4TC91_9ASCO|nr:hypothetical protein CANCADRAFT_139234 [Tortispora caseinolytica NRRL Y-17796]